MRHFIPTFIFAFFATACFGQYTTPNNGATYTLEDLVDLSDGVVDGAAGEFQLYEALTIAEDDTLMVANAELAIAQDVLITVAGALITADAVFTQLDCCESYYTGFRFEETAAGVFENTTVEYGGGMQVITPNFVMDNSIVRYNIGDQSAFSAISFSEGTPEITNTHFEENEFSAISSPANGAVAPQITDCVFLNNVTDNANRPQINLGPSGADTARVTGCTLVGNPSSIESGNISMALLTGGDGHIEISDCEISGARYGVNIYGGNLHSKVTGCVITGNNIQNEPMLGGSGISITGFGDNNQHEIRGNEFRENLWGITLIGTAQANLGEIDGIGAGNNTFDDNGNGGNIFALFNNTENDIPAEGNCWIESNPDATPEEVEDVISHLVDDSELGEVFFLPLGECDPVTSTRDINFADFATAYPNPSNGVVNIDFTGQVNGVMVYNNAGQIVFQESALDHTDRMQIDFHVLPAGLYLLRMDTPKGSATQKLVIQ